MTIQTQFNNWMTRPDGTRYQVGRAQERGDLCYRNKAPGWYWHNLDEQSGIVESSVTGPFLTADNANTAAQLRVS